jgi:flagellar motility protein MotE (MotC chaperone)
MKALTEKWDALERKAGDLDKKKQEVGKQQQEVKQSLFEVENVEQKNVKRMAATFDAMDADTAGELLQHMVDGGKLELAAKIMAMMQERQAARVCSQMQDRATVVQLIERMNRLRRPASAP